MYSVKFETLALSALKLQILPTCAPNGTTRAID